MSVAGLQLRNVTKTCGSHPAQWEADSDQGKVYIRYRFGRLAVGIGVDIDAAIDAAMDAPVHAQAFGGEWDGEMETGEMLSLTGMVTL